MYKEQFVKMKHNLEGNNVNATPKQWCVKEVENSITPKDPKINFVGCMHNMIWSMERRKVN